MILLFVFSVLYASKGSARGKNPGSVNAQTRYEATPITKKNEPITGSATLTLFIR